MNGNKYFHMQSDNLFIISYIHAILFRQGEQVYVLVIPKLSFHPAGLINKCSET